MKTIVFAAQKGGVGKTTLATHLSAEYALDGVKVVLFDADPQRSAAYWGERQAYNVTYGKVTPLTLAPTLDDAAAGGFDLAIVDTAGSANDDNLMHVVKPATLVVVPIPPREYDYMALSATLANIRAAKAQVAAVISRAEWNDSRITPMRKMLEDGGIHVLDTVIHRHMEYTTQSLGGKLARDSNTRCKAALEVRALRRELDTLLGDDHA